MGIPFYFASLCKSHPDILKTIQSFESFDVDVLGIDFNCLIHTYIQSENPIESILEGLRKILLLCRAKKTFLAFDGLVPYAKIVQQRFRRMKIQTDEFDKHQISPCTPFMRELESKLLEEFPSIHISTTAEKGEGEHKLLESIGALSSDERKSVCIYGLDADLILLCLLKVSLSAPNKFFLLREQESKFTLLSLWKLQKAIPIEINQYIALSLLCFGNDFMPSLGMFSLREGGYDRALQMYFECRPNLLSEEGRRKFFLYCVEKEWDVIKSRIFRRNRPEEKALVKEKSLFSKKYGLHILDGVSNMKPVVDSYWNTFHWTLYYFQNNKPLNWDWTYSYSDAPLLEDICKYPESCSIVHSEIQYSVINQLQVILPSKSLRTAKKLVKFPDELYEDTRNPFMKKYDWEMKPRISIPWHPTEPLTHSEIVRILI